MPAASAAPKSAPRKSANQRSATNSSGSAGLDEGQLLAALRAVAVPRIFVLVLAMTYRYVFVLLDAVDEMFMARKARTVHAEAAAARGRPFVAASAGALFGRAHALSDEVHQAMVSRGDTGDARTLAAARWRTADVAWVVGCAVVVLAVVVGDRSLGPLGA